MESDQELTRQLRTIERAEAAPFVEYPPTPPWYPFAVAAWFTALVLTLSWLYESRLNVAAAAVLLALALLEFAFLGWMRRRWGTWPRMRTAPAEIRSAYLHCYAGVAAIGAVVAVAWLLGGRWVAAALTFVAIAALLAWYERHYAEAARRVKERLA